MALKKQKRLYVSFIISYFVLNIINTYFLTSQVLNRYISPFKHTFIGELTAILGNFSILLLIFFIISLFAKKDKSRMISLLVATSILNLLIFALGFFNLFYGTAFATNALDIFKNPAEGIASGMFREVMHEVFIYYRILVFVPLVVLIVLFAQYMKNQRITKEENVLVNNNFKHYLSMGLGFISILLVSTFSFQSQLRNSDLPLGSVVSTYAVQNYGVYPFYMSNLFGIDFDLTSRKSMNLKTEEDLKEAYTKYNKNQEEYTNLLDNLVYSNNIKVKDTNAIINGLGEDDLVNGIFKDKNLILVHLESINHFLLELDEIKERMPFLHSLFEESYVFENYYTSVGMGVSADAELSILTGLYMNGYSTLYWDYNKNKYDLDTIPKKLAEKGYETMPIHGDKKGFYNRDVAYPGLIGFNNEYYSLESFAKDANMEVNEYRKYLREVGYEYDNGQFHKSPWTSDMQLAEFTYETSKNFGSQRHMLFPIFMMPHTPFKFDPFEGIERPGYNKWDKQLSGATKRYIDFADYIDKSIQSLFISPTGENRILEDNVYVFYSDHGSSLKNGDMSVLYDKELNLLEERKILQKTTAFIYAPGSKDVEHNGFKIKEGLIKGSQPLVRSHIDLYRTIVDLFGLVDEGDFYFGVNGISNEPTFVIDNRILDLIVDDLEGSEYILSLRNPNKNFHPKGKKFDNDKLLEEIVYFKRLSDLLLTNDKNYIDVKKALQK